MLEKDIENLIAMHPEEFFPRSGFKLIRQQETLGKCRADIIFEDKYDRKIIVEIKRGILTRESSGQILEYYGLLKEQFGNEIIELILCANIIPFERRAFLEKSGIECKELGLYFIQEIAKKYNYKFKDEIETKNIEPNNTKINTDTKSSQDKIKVWFFQANPDRYDILGALSDKELKHQCFLVNRYKNEIKKGHTVLMWISGKYAGIYAVAEIISDPEVRADFISEEKYWINKEDKEEKRLKVVIEIKQNLVNNPLLKNEIKNVEELKNLSIFKFHQGTNFPVSDAEWQIISKMIYAK